MAVDKSNAPGILLGFGLQVTRLTALLFEASPGSLCSVEVLDDVAEECDAKTKLVQSKSAVATNPVSDKAIALWKTFATWSRLVNSGKITPKQTTFEIYVSKPVTGGIVASFHRCCTAIEAKTAIQNAKAILADQTDDLKTHTDEFFNLDPGKAAEILIRFSLVCGSGSPHDDLEAIVRKHPVSPNRVKELTVYMLGWVKAKAETLLEKGQPAIISSDEFHTAYVAIRKKVDRQDVLNSASTALRREDSEAKVREQSTFVRQMMLIEWKYDQMLSAVNDFMRAAIDRTAWALAGEVDQGSLDELEEVLQRTWANNRTRCELAHSDKSPVDQGKFLLLDCMDFQTLVQGMQVPHYFISGCFHKLADEPKIGWHPSYEGLLKGEED